MHRALLVNDIVYTVLQHVKSSATDMIHFACTYSALSSPALDILWRVQFNLGPLIMCLPQDTWEIRDNVIVSDLHHEMGHCLPLCSTFLANHYLRNGSVLE